MAPLAIYIHWPYCARICPYCDFNVYKAKGSDTALCDAIVLDLTSWRRDTGPREVSSIHFGGGTPSLLSANEIGRFINHIDDLWGISEHTEIALEANPNDANRMKWEAYQTAGITRLSMGVQSFNDLALKMLGRDHDSAQAKNALKDAVKIFPSVSADLIFGWAGQSALDLSSDLNAFLEMGLGHISTYQLTIEADTAFAKAEARGQKHAVTDDQSADYFETVMSVLASEGYDHYEVSNFAKPGHESRHNLAYWRGYDYVGVGPGAHGRLTKAGSRIATICATLPKTYIETVKATGKGINEAETLNSEAWAEEYLLMGLRINEGISLSRFAELRGNELPITRFKPLIEQGFLERNDDRLFATQKGRFVLNAVTEALLV